MLFRLPPARSTLQGGNLRVNLIIGSPAKYIQGNGAINDIGKYVNEMALGKKALVTGGPRSLAATRSRLESSFKTANISYTMETFHGETSRPEIDRLAALGKQIQADFVVGIGGGKAIDTAKVVSVALKCPVVIVPTVAASDASCSATAQTFTEEHFASAAVVRARNPELVLVSTDIIVKAPVKYLVAGMGDALSTKFEAEAAHKTGARNFHSGRAAQSALTMARWCSDTIVEKGLAAKKANERGVTDPDFEAVVESAIYASSISWENCGIAVAHGLTFGFTIHKEVEVYLHGELMGFFSLVQLVLEKTAPAYLNQIFQFCRAVGLPVTLSGIGLKNASPDMLRRGITFANKAPFVRLEPFPVTPEMLFAAVVETDRIGSQL
jgi:glycerol dehydrogenase